MDDVGDSIEAKTMPMVRSGTSTERIVRAVLLSLFVDVFAIAFLRDGYVEYARDNARKLVRSLGLADSTPPNISKNLTAAEGRRLANEFKPGADGVGILPALGAVPLQHGDDAYYFGPGGHLRLRGNAGRIDSVEWFDGVHTEADLSIQRAIGLILTALSFVAAAYLGRVLLTRVQVDERGVGIRGRPPIALEAITALRLTSRSGSAVELEYNLDGRTRMVRLDDYLFKDLRGVVGAICERRGFTNPLDLTTKRG